MARTSTWWRRLGTALAALVLAVLTLGPGLDGLLCFDEGGLSAAAAELPATQLEDHADGLAQDQGGPGACLHGHCHHGAPYVPVAVPVAETPVDLTGINQPPPRGRVATSDRQFGLMRPPRA